MNFFRLFSQFSLGLLFLPATWVAEASAHAADSSCPDLRGVYLCPAVGATQPAARLTVNQEKDSGDRKVTVYRFRVEEVASDGTLGTPIESTVRSSGDGIRDESGVEWSCVRNRLTSVDPSRPSFLVQQFREKKTHDYIIELVGVDGTGGAHELERCVSL